MAERRVHPNCIYKSNPYHECVESCFEKMARAQTTQLPPKKKSGSFIVFIPKKLSFKKKLSSDLNPSKSLDAEPNLKPSLDHPISPIQLSFTKVESWNCDLTFRGPDKNRTQEPEPEQDPRKGEGTDEQGTVEDNTMNSNHTNSQVLVGNYNVKDSAAKILISIIGKFGDIAKGCKLESEAMRSYYLECLCSAIDDLQRKAPARMTESNMTEMLAIVKDAELVGINVGWMSPVVVWVKETAELIRQRRAVEVKRRESDATIGSLRKVLELRLGDVVEMEKAVKVAKAKVEETRVQLAALEQESSRLSETVKSIEAKVDGVDWKSMVGEILLLS